LRPPQKSSAKCSSQAPTSRTAQPIYLRARGNYLKSNSNYYTPYTDVMTFVYSSAAGIDAIGTDADARTVIRTTMTSRAARSTPQSPARST